MTFHIYVHIAEISLDGCFTSQIIKIKKKPYEVGNKVYWLDFSKCVMQKEHILMLHLELDGKPFILLEKYNDTIV